MKRAVAEIWVSDELAVDAGKLTEERLEEAMQEGREAGLLGIRVTLPDGTVLRAGQTFG